MGTGIEEESLELFLNPNGTMPEFRGCECCRPRSYVVTSTSTWHRWTKKEIQEQIMDFAKRIAYSKWYERSNLRRGLKHWVEKLEKFEEAEAEFKF